MNTQRIAWLLGLVVAIAANSSLAAVINMSMVIDASNSFPGQTVEIVDGANPPTVVDVVEGGIVDGRFGFADIVARGQSQVNLMGGVLSAVELHERSQLKIHGVFEDAGASAEDSAKVYLKDDARFGGVILRENSTFRSEKAFVDRVLSYGNAVARLIDTKGLYSGLNTEIYAWDTSTVRIRGGVQEGIDANDDSVIWYDSGAVQNWVRLYDRSAFHLLDANYQITDFIRVRDNATLHFYGTDLTYRTDIENELPTATGFYPDGTAIWQSVLLHDNGRIVFHTVPEPASAAVFALGVLAIAVSRRLTAR